MKTLQFLLCGTLVATLSSGAFGSVLFESNFDAGYTANTTLNGQTGSSNVGTTGNWSYTPGATDVTNGNYMKVVDSTGNYNMTYNVSGGGTIAGGSHSIDFTTSAAGDTTTAAISLSAPITGQTIFTRILVKPLNQVFNGTADLMFTLGAPGGTTPFFGERTTGGAAGFHGFYDNPTQTATSGVVANSIGTSYLIVSRFDWNGTSGKYDTANVWVNPAYSDSGAPLASKTDTADAFASFNTVGLIDINMPGNRNYAFDSFVIGTTWNDVVPVPEPSTYALVAFGGFLLFLAVRRRNVRA